MAKSEVKDIDRGWRAMRDGASKLGPVAVKVGILEAAGVHETAGSGRPMTVAEVAAVNEYGSSDGKIPERPAWRNALDSNKTNIVAMLQKASEQLMQSFASLGSASVPVIFGRVGLYGQALIRRGIDQLTSPPNAPMTIARKGSSKPLIDTAQTRNSVTFEVITGNDVTEARQDRGVR